MSAPTKEMRSHWEGLAYTDGQAAARAKKPFDDCPFCDAALVKAWRDGHIHTTLRRQLDLRIDTPDAETMRIAVRDRCAKCFGAVGDGYGNVAGCIIDRRVFDCGGPYTQYQLFKIEDDQS